MENEDKRYPVYDWMDAVRRGETMVGYDKWKQNRQDLDNTEESEVRKQKVAQARELYADDDLEVDEDAAVFYGDSGCWVDAHVFVEY